MKTFDEVKQELYALGTQAALDLLQAAEKCPESTYSQVSKALCGKENATNEELLQAVDQLKSRLAQAERERDAAVHDVQSLCATNYFSGDYCEYCKYREPDGQCFHDCTPYSSEWGWEWRGVCEENTKEEGK